MAKANVTRWVLVLLVAFALLLTLRVVEPFFTAFFIASVLAAALAPLREAARPSPLR